MNRAGRVQLIADKVVVARGERRVIDGLSFAVAGGTALLLTGPNGAGKTTLIRAIAGFLRPVAGSIDLRGGDDERPLAEQCHYVGHLNGLKSNLTVAENVAFWGAYLSDTALPAHKRDAALDALGLAPIADVAAGYLSAGQKRRACLARLLAADRPVWLLDEPTVSLDAASTAILAGLIKTQLAGGGIVLAATHVGMGLDDAPELRLSPPAFAAQDDAP